MRRARGNKGEGQEERLEESPAWELRKIEVASPQQQKGGKA